MCFWFLPTVSGRWDNWGVPNQLEHHHWWPCSRCFSYPATNLSSIRWRTIWKTHPDRCLLVFKSYRNWQASFSKPDLGLWSRSMATLFLIGELAVEFSLQSCRCLYLGFPRFKMDNSKKKTACFPATGSLDTTTSPYAIFKGFKTSLWVLGIHGLIMILGQIIKLDTLFSATISRLCYCFLYVLCYYVLWNAFHLSI